MFHCPNCHNETELFAPVCNECNNYALPTISSLSLRMHPSNLDSWIAPSDWTAATTEAPSRLIHVVVVI